MKLPVRNYASVPLMLIIEPLYLEFEIPAGGEAIVTMEEGCYGSIDYHPDQCVTIWDESASQTADVKVYPNQQSLGK